MHFVRRTKASQGQLNTSPRENNVEYCLFPNLALVRCQKWLQAISSQSLSVAEMLKLGKTIKKTSTSSQLKISTWRQWFGHVADLLKQSIINPCPRFPRLEKFNLTWDLSLWHAKVMEGFARKTLIHTSTQGRGTPPRTPWFILYRREATDGGNCGAKMFFTDYLKGFDLIDHSTLLRELASFDIDTVLINWISAFLTRRSKTVRIGNSLPD